MKFDDILVKYQVLIMDADNHAVEAMYFDSSNVAKAYANDYNHYVGDIPVDMLSYTGGTFAIYNGAFPIDA